MFSIWTGLNFCCLVESLSTFRFNPFPNKALVFMYLLYRSFQNTVGKEEIACNELFLLFPQCF